VIASDCISTPPATTPPKRAVVRSGALVLRDLVPQ